MLSFWTCMSSKPPSKSLPRIRRDGLQPIRLHSETPSLFFEDEAKANKEWSNFLQRTSSLEQSC